MKYSDLLLSCGIMCIALSAAAQLDPRINYSTYLGGSKTTCTDGGPGGTRCSTQPAAKATASALGVTDTFKCTRSTPLLKGHGWGPITLTVHVNASSGTTLSNTAKVSAKTQDVFQASNTKTV
jgi:hypothetical protein